MRKLSVLVAIALLVAACGGSTTPTPSAAASTEADLDITGPVTLTLWHALTSDPQKGALEAAVKRFNETNGKGITVQAVVQGNYTQLYQKTLGGKLDLILHLRVRRVARPHMRRRVNGGHRLAARRGQPERHRGRIEPPRDDVRWRLATRSAKPSGSPATSASLRFVRETSLRTHASSLRARPRRSRAEPAAAGRVGVRVMGVLHEFERA